MLCALLEALNPSGVVLQTFPIHGQAASDREQGIHRFFGRIVCWVCAMCGVLRGSPSKQNSHRPRPALQEPMGRVASRLNRQFQCSLISASWRLRGSLLCPNLGGRGPGEWIPSGARGASSSEQGVQEETCWRCCRQRDWSVQRPEGDGVLAGCSVACGKEAQWARQRPKGVPSFQSWLYLASMSHSTHKQQVSKYRTKLYPGPTPSD